MQNFTSDSDVYFVAVSKYLHKERQSFRLSVSLTYPFSTTNF